VRDLKRVAKEEQYEDRKKKSRKVKLDIRHQTYFILTKEMKLDFNFFVFNRRLNMGNIKPLLIKMNIIGYGRLYFQDKVLKDHSQKNRSLQSV
jgi:hypothetical protein